MEHPVIGFGLEYAGQLLFCEVLMQETYYDTSFNGKWVCSIEHTEDFEWIQASGVVLPQEIIDEIGFRIDSHFK